MSFNRKKICQCSEVDFNNVKVSELNNGSHQSIAFIKDANDNKSIVVQTGVIKMTSWGIPRLNKFCSEDRYREFILIPLDINQAGCNELKNLLEDADRWANSEQVKNKLFGEKAGNYQYHPSVRGQKNDDDENEKISPEKIPYVKMKFDVHPGSNQQRIINTKLFDITSSGARVPINVETITDITSYVRYMKQIRITFTFNKIWVMRTPLPKSYRIMYGLGFKVNSIDIINCTIKTIGIEKPIYSRIELRKSYKRYLDDKRNAMAKKVAIEI